MPPVDLRSWEYLLFGILGLLAGGIGIATMRAVTWCEAMSRRLPVAWLRPAVGGLLLSGIAAGFPQVLGSGHGAIETHFDSALPLVPLVLLLLAKMAASAVSIGAGFRGGLFSSALFLGCLFGETIFRAVALMFPVLADQQIAFMLVGMGAVAAAIIGAPITMVLLVLEATGDFRIGLGVVVGVVTAATLVRYTFGYSFATWRFHQRGVAIRGAYDIGWVADITVGRMMRHDVMTVGSDVPLMRLRELVPLGSRSRVFAVDDSGAYAGIIDVTIIHDADLDAAAPGLVAGDLAAGGDLFLWPNQNIRTALTRFTEAEMEALPVLAAPDDHRIVGYLTEAHALRRYTEELERRRSAELGERDLFSVGPVE
jgi:CIC family chloride channel protein